MQMLWQNQASSAFSVGRGTFFVDTSIVGGRRVGEEYQHAPIEMILLSSTTYTYAFLLGKKNQVLKVVHIMYKQHGLKDTITHILSILYSVVLVD